VSRQNLIRKGKHLLEYAPLWIVSRLSRCLTFSQFSDLGAKLGRFVGRLYPRFSNVADKNICRAFPSYTDDQRKQLIIAACENLGRTFFEYFSYDRALLDPKFQVHIDEESSFLKYKGLGRPIVFVSAHFGNWEIGAFESYRHDFPVTPIYRAINNPYVDNLILKCRAPHVVEQIPKGKTAGIRCLRTLKKGNSIVVLADQKNDQGLQIPFFGHLAPTVDGFVKLAQSSDALIVPIRIIRKNGTQFHIYTDPPLDPRQFGDDVEGVLVKINGIIEGWIRQNPDQWFWFHRRWAKSYYRE